MAAAKKQAASKASDSKSEASACAVDGCDQAAEYVPGLCKAHYDTHRGFAREPESKD